LHGFILLLQGHKPSMARKSFEIKHFYAIRAKKNSLPDRARVRSATLLCQWLLFSGPIVRFVLPSMANVALALAVAANDFLKNRVSLLRGSPPRFFRAGRQLPKSFARQ